MIPNCKVVECDRILNFLLRWLRARSSLILEVSNDLSCVPKLIRIYNGPMSFGVFVGMFFNATSLTSSYRTVKSECFSLGSESPFTRDRLWLPIRRKFCWRCIIQPYSSWRKVACMPVCYIVCSNLKKKKKSKWIMCFSLY